MELSTCLSSSSPLPTPAAFLPLSSLSADVPTVEVLEWELAWLKEHLCQLDSPVVFCHNDLLCKNIIYDRAKGTAAPASGRLPPSGCCSNKPRGLGLKLMCRGRRKGNTA